MEDKEDYYKILGLQVRCMFVVLYHGTKLNGLTMLDCRQNLRFRATQDDIKRAYRQCVLKYHPDKLAQKEGQEAKEEAEVRSVLQAK